MNANEYVIKSATLADRHGERFADVVIRDGVIAAIGPDLAAPHEVSAHGCVITSPLVDLCAHSGEPGREEIETIASLSRAAALGGFGTVLLMATTEPVADSAAVVQEITARTVDALCRIEIAGALTVGCNGEQLAPMAELAALGIKIFTDAGSGIQSSRLLRRAMEYGAGLNVTIAQRCHDAALGGHAVMHEGAVSSKLGMVGSPSEAEEIAVMRDLALSRLTGARLHLQQVSTAGSVAMIEGAKAAGMDISCDVATQHVVFTDEACESFDPRFRLEPPLRSATDREAIAAGLASGVIDAIVSQHTPVADHEKDQPFDQAPPGTLGLEYAFALAMTHSSLSLQQLLPAMSWRPGQILGLSGTYAGTIAPGMPADLIVIDPQHEWTIPADGGASLSRNVCFAEMNVRGKVRHSFVGGELVVHEFEATR